MNLITTDLLKNWNNGASYSPSGQMSSICAEPGRNGRFKNTRKEKKKLLMKVENWGWILSMKWPTVVVRGRWRHNKHQDCWGICCSTTELNNCTITHKTTDEHVINVMQLTHWAELQMQFNGDELQSCTLNLLSLFQTWRQWQCWFHISVNL